MSNDTDLDGLLACNDCGTLFVGEVCDKCTERDYRAQCELDGDDED